ncbi:MAG: hypothetical protein JWR37_4430, partial [Mycobacterium sp.]|nr:hypothetical protein [Mycobacterium sp.]
PLPQWITLYAAIVVPFTSPLSPMTGSWASLSVLRGARRVGADARGAGVGASAGRAVRVGITRYSIVPDDMRAINRRNRDERWCGMTSRCSAAQGIQL